jgi:hypothetical protein
VTKEAVSFAMQTFDPAAPPAQMPPLSPGEAALCDSNFTSSARISATNDPVDSTHAMLTITDVNVTLGANVTIWTPLGVSDHVIEHEQGHRQISEYYYRTADQLARQIAATYIGRQVPIAGADLNSAASRKLQQLASEFTDTYGKQLNPDPAQQIFDTITNHSLNQTPVSDAIAAALKEAEISAPPPVANAGN